ncbi:hypothetical protein WJX73_002564 [Symbiochloris irregularis]|uniref:Photosystem I reaction center subunit III n=1 Tax=Symbiochloris irregularis TaxID=706552 RepID=A0AAW1PLL9_9CHLO
MMASTLQSRTGLKGQSLAVRPAQPQCPRVVARSAVCAALPDNKTVGKAVTAAALAAVLGFGAVQEARADVAGLTPCSQSKAYNKRQKNEVKGLQKRLKQYEPDSAPAIALKATIERTEKRFEIYAKQNLLCGSDGLPHLISDPGLAFRYGHQGEVFLPTIGFLYVAGYIGSVGREYLNYFKKNVKKPTEKEIIIDVPTALRLSAEGAIWPWRVVQQLRNGSLLEKDENITVSPR